ncbi:SurA N-terminal domain-containing protein [soil metagenome]
MLDSLKKYTSGWIAQLLLLLLVLSFAVWGVADIFTGYGTNAVAKVGSREISAQEFQRRYDIAVQALTRQFGQQITPDQARQFGVPTQVLSRLLAEAVLDNTAHSMGLGLSNERVAQLVMSDPSLMPAGTPFSRVLFAQIAQQQGMTEDQFVLDRRAEYVRSQLAQAFIGGLAPPEAFLKAVAEYRGDVRDISYVVLAAPDAASIPEPSAADLSAYFDAHKSDWKAPEYRALNYFEVSPSTVSKVDEVTDDEAKKRYDGAKDRFITVGTRQVSQIVFKDKADADAAAAAIASGKTFDDLVTERNLKPADIDLGQVSKSQINDPAVADAAFALAEDGVSGVVAGKFGPVMVRVKNVKPEVVKTFDEVKGTLKGEIAAERAATEINDVHDSIEDARAGGTTIPEVAKKFEMKLVTLPAIDAAGKDPDGKVIDGVPAGLAQAAFDTDVGLESDPLEFTRNSFAWYEVTGITPPKERTLEEVRDKLVVAWKDAERGKKLVDAADAIKKRLDGGEDIAKVAADSSLEVKKAEKVVRNTTPGGDINGDVLEAVFGGPKEHTAIATGATPMSRVVLVVDSSTVPAYVAGSPDLDQTKQQLTTQFINDLLAAYIGELQSKTNVQLNNAVLQTALGVKPN